MTEARFADFPNFRQTWNVRLIDQVADQPHDVKCNASSAIRMAHERSAGYISGKQEEDVPFPFFLCFRKASYSIKSIGDAWFCVIPFVNPQKL